MGSILDSSTLFRDDFVRVQDSNPRPNSGRSGGLPLDYVVADNEDEVILSSTTPPRAHSVAARVSARPKCGSRIGLNQR